jgi:hypothetical protein
MNAAKPSEYYKSIKIPAGISEEGKNFILTACAVPLEELPMPTGVPDKDQAKSNVRALKQELDIDLSAFYNSGAVNTASMDIVVWPWERQMQMFDGDLDIETRWNLGENAINTGGVTIYINNATSGSSSVFPTPGNKHVAQPINTDTNGVYGQTLTMPDSFYANDRLRVVGSYTELFYTSGKSTATGSVIAWKIDQTPQEGEYFNFENQNRIANVANSGEFVLPIQHLRYPMPLGSSADAHINSDSIDIDGVEKGFFMPDEYEHTDNEAQYPMQRSIMVENNSVLVQNSGAQITKAGLSNVTLANQRPAFACGTLIALGSNTAYGESSMAPRNYYCNRVLKGVRFENLNCNPGNTSIAPFKCKIIRTVIVEAFSDTQNPVTASNMKRSPAYEPDALQAYELIQSQMPTAFPVDWNGRKKYVNKIRTDMNIVMDHLRRNSWKPLLIKPAPREAIKTTTVKSIGGKGKGKKAITTTTSTAIVRVPKRTAGGGLPQRATTNGKRRNASKK